MGKSIWTSKTFWTNLIAISAIIAQGMTGKQIIDPEIQASILAVINIILRAITKEPISWE